ncbi:hypothetical protein [Chamaesiphon sp.]|uniref:hypothetical protein n=1 Tax=Chamaesiphon sp. TaxID=2814140 RepID=UPI0035941604
MNLLPHQYPSIAYYSVLMAILIALTGCQQSPKAIGTIEGGKVADGNIALPCKFGEDKTTTTATDKSRIILTLDGSASMVGYAKDGNSHYVQTLKLLDRVSLAAPGGVEYARIDTGRRSIDRTEFQKSFGAGFYTGQTSRLADTFPDLKTVKGEQLIAVVTDLQPDDGDVNAVSKRILEDYLKKDGYAVAIWGIGSEFEGKVYPPNNAPAYDYAGKSTATSRPFYILLVGKYEAISEFTKTIRSADSSSLLKDRSQLTIFTADRTIANPSYLAASEDNLPKGITSPDSLSQDRFSMENGEQPIQFLEVNENSNSDKQALKYTLKYQANPDTAAPNQLEPRYQVRKYNEEKEKPAFVDRSDKSLLDINSSLVDDKLGVEMKFDPEKIDRGLYYVTADLTARSIQAPAVWKEWDDGGKKDGSKTQGLNDFLNSLSINTTSVMKEKSPVVARLCYGIQRN